MERKLLKPCLTNYHLLTVQDLWQILMITLLKEFIKLNVNINIIIKKCERCEIKCKNFE